MKTNYVALASPLFTETFGKLSAKENDEAELKPHEYKVIGTVTAARTAYNEVPVTHRNAIGGLIRQTKYRINPAGTITAR